MTKYDTGDGNRDEWSVSDRTHRRQQLMRQIEATLYAQTSACGDRAACFQHQQHSIYLGERGKALARPTPQQGGAHVHPQTKCQVLGVVMTAVQDHLNEPLRWWLKAKQKDI